QRFVQDGGLLVTLANAGTLAVDGGLVGNVSKSPPGVINSPGSEVRVKILQAQSPITYGYETFDSVFRGNGPLFDVEDRFRGFGAVQFGTKKVREDDDREATASTHDAAKPSMRGGAAGATMAPAGSAAGAASASGGANNTAATGAAGAAASGSDASKAAT